MRAHQEEELTEDEQSDTSCDSEDSDTCSSCEEEESERYDTEIITDIDYLFTDLV